MTFLSWLPAAVWQGGSGWQGAALFACVAAVAAAAYWIGFQHGAASKKRTSAPPTQKDPELSPATPAAPVHHIPPYRVKELIVLMELGVLTPEEFEHEKGKLHAGR